MQLKITAILRVIQENKFQVFVKIRPRICVAGRKGLWQRGGGEYEYFFFRKELVL